MKTEQAEVLASSYASLLTDRIATKDDLKALEDRMDARFEAHEDRMDSSFEALEDRLNARIAYAQLAAVLALSAVMVMLTFFAA